ncbi:actin-associated protein FAM107A isoform X1 [Anas platyrhynchos]|uniref:actin-associated protein FAM107A isoform X1 n=1 Tax=Anas platyrhynchos TaxID=8839 RepID=UPI000F7C3B15|nr:actin-associated protein FAM107A isoform X1 [Anas platyrhynchos]|eukprot:XP_027323840.1 actin-associated protein FAM107A isoform X1 [Anas platyrhynchos]
MGWSSALHGGSRGRRSCVVVSCPPGCSGTGACRVLQTCWTMGATHGKKKEYSLQPRCAGGSGKPVSGGSASMYTEIQREHPDSRNILTHPDYIDGNPDLIKPKKLLNPVKASKSHQELHRELLMNHKRGLGVESKPELQRVLEHRRRNQLFRQKKEEEEAKKLQSPFEKELLKRHQRLDQLEKEQEKEEDHAPEFIKVKENLRRTSTVTGEEKAA